LSNKLIQHSWYIAGAALVVEAGSCFCWNTACFWLSGTGELPVPPEKWFFLAVVVGAYAGAFAVARYIVSMPLCGRIPSVLLGVSISFLVSMTLIFTMRAYYSRPFLIIAFAASFCWLYIGQRLFFSASQIRYGFTPGSIIQELKHEWRSNFVEIISPDSPEAFDILVVSPYQDRPLPPRWTRYITNMMIHGIPMVHPGRVYEFFIGRLPLEYMAEGPGVMIRPRGYCHLKVLFDWTMLIALGLPALLCIGAVALAVLCFSGRPVFFVQRRVGKNGKVFRMIKFRSMTRTGKITGIGRLLRKYRLDELPQIWNVLRGEMSFIGPRPETPDLTLAYTQKIPFYPYRYSILPGITGWAQVNYGYASVTSENKIKLSYDLYYVKHASLLLDILIVLKTIKTMVAGFGAK
jgi:lipopolysaccharide/colanic/teichoic acid biosynthesis glycosyltransferase